MSSFRLHDITPAGPGWATLEISCDNERLTFSAPGLMPQSEAVSLRVPEKHALKVLAELDDLMPRLEEAADSLPDTIGLEVRLDASLGSARAEASLAGQWIHLAWGSFGADDAPAPLAQKLIDIALEVVVDHESWKVIGMPSRGRDGEYLLFAQRPGATISLSCNDLDTSLERVRQASRVVALLEESGLRLSDGADSDGVSIRLVDQTLEARYRGLELELPTSAVSALQEFAARAEWLTGPEAVERLSDLINVEINQLAARAIAREGRISIQLADESEWDLSFEMEAALRLPLEGVGEWRAYCQAIAERTRGWVLAREELEALDPQRTGWTDTTLWERLDDLPVIRAAAAGMVAEREKRHQRLRSTVAERLSDWP